jgi:hypothetical protein
MHVVPPTQPHIESEVTSHSIYRTVRNVFVNNFKAIGKLAWHLAGAPVAFCVELCARAPALLLCVNVANPAMPRGSPFYPGFVLPGFASPGVNKGKLIRRRDGHFTRDFSFPAPFNFIRVIASYPRSKIQLYRRCSRARAPFQARHYLFAFPSSQQGRSFCQSARNHRVSGVCRHAQPDPGAP